MDNLRDNNIPFKSFEEPDINNKITAIATAPLEGGARLLFKKLQLF